MTRLSDHQLHDLLKRQGYTPDFTPPKPRKKRSNEESRMQQAVIKWWALKCREFGVPECLLFAIPNGARRDKVVGAILKKEGVRAGVPDLFLAVPRHCWHGVFIELKIQSGIVSDLQVEFIEALGSQMYGTAVCRSYESVIHTIESYLIE